MLTYSAEEKGREAGGGGGGGGSGLFGMRSLHVFFITSSSGVIYGSYVGLLSSEPLTSAQDKSEPLHDYSGGCGLCKFTQPSLLGI